MRDTFLADAQSAPPALLFGDAVQADDYLDNLTGDEYRALLSGDTAPLEDGARTAPLICRLPLTSFPTIIYRAARANPTATPRSAEARCGCGPPALDAV